MAWLAAEVSHVIAAAAICVFHALLSLHHSADTGLAGHTMIAGSNNLQPCQASKYPAASISRLFSVPAISMMQAIPHADSRHMMVARDTMIIHTIRMYIGKDRTTQACCGQFPRFEASVEVRIRQQTPFGASSAFW